MHVFHVRVVQDASIKTTTRLVPQVSLRFEGVDSTGQKFGFDVALDKLIAALQGMTIGRAAGQCELVVPHATVSRRHARVRTVRSDDSVVIQDLGSKNGTLVRGAPITGEVRLTDGAVIQIGSVELTLRIWSEGKSSETERIPQRRRNRGER